METGRYIGRADQSHQRSVISIADAPSAESFTQIAVDIDNIKSHGMSSLSFEFPARYAQENISGWR
jgi:hypothetical protein